jgi:integrase/recombinase XerD
MSLEIHRCADCKRAVDASAKDCPYCWSQRLVWVDASVIKAERKSRALVATNVAATSPAITLPFDTKMLAGQLRESSIAMYERDIAAYLAFAGSAEAALDAATFSRWRAALAADAKAYSPHTINRMLAAVKRLMAEAAQQGHISHETAASFADRGGVKVKALKERLRPNNKTFIAPADMRRLIGLADTSTIKGLRDRALLLTLASSGVRLSEAASITPEQIERADVNGKQGYILKVTGKTDEEPRQAPLSQEAHDAIEAWLVRRPVASPYVFTAADGRGNRWTGRPIAEENIEKLVQRYAERAGLKHVKPHDFRRFVGTQLSRQDIRKAQKALGHKRIETTTRYILDDLEPGMTDDLF